jgi:glycosyltransferase involved in cell wall biosynthesis
MPQWYSAADVLVSASRSEFHPVTVLEAMACGLPVVAGDDAAFDSLVAHGDTGLRAATDAGIASAVLRVLDDADLRRRLAAGSVAACRHHRGAAVSARWEAIYRRLFGRTLGSSDVLRREETGLTANGAPPTLTLPASNLPPRPEFH